MNVKKKILYLELFPITYHGKQYKCTISRRKDTIFRIVRIIIILGGSLCLFIYPNLISIMVKYFPISLPLFSIILIIECSIYRSLQLMGIHFNCCIMEINKKRDKVFKTNFFLPWWKVEDFRRQNFEWLAEATFEAFERYNNYQAEEFELNRQKNWDGIISLEKTEVKGATNNDK